MNWDKLRAPIPRENVHWRCQTLTREGDKGLALAYIDARDLMERLDEACGPENWQDSYHETAKGRVVCTISIRIDGDWISKSDGAGETDVEGDKGAISDAFKRAGVKWGVARELYSLGDVWCPCVSAPFNGKPRWKKWADDPWKYVKGSEKPRAAPAPQSNEKTEEARAELEHLYDTMMAALDDCPAHEIDGFPNAWKSTITRLRSEAYDLRKRFGTEYEKARIRAADNATSKGANEAA